PGGGALTRPLMEGRREHVLAHLAARGLGWVEDRSNRDPRFLRNRVRAEVLPELARVAGPRVVEALCRSAALSRALVDDLEARARAELARLGRRGQCGVVFEVAALLALPAEVAAETLFNAAAAQGDARPRRGAIHRGVRRLLAPAPARRALSLGGLVMERSGRWLRVGPARPPALAVRRWEVPGDLVLDEVGVRLEARGFDRAPGYAPPRARDRVAFDADRLPRTLLVRPRRRGERFAPFGGPGERRIKSLLSDEGVPRWERSRIPLLEADGDVAWVAGLRRGRLAPIESETKRILEVTLFPL